MAPFAAFACRLKFANMVKKFRFCSHWDKKVVHAAFLAKRDIQPYEELTYMRRDEGAPHNSDLMCGCGNPDCGGFL